MSNGNIESPRLKSLYDDIKAGTVSAIDTFWQKITTNGSPIVEPIEGNNTHSLLTFLYRSLKELDGVSVISAVTEDVFTKMTRLRDSNLWYHTCKVSNDLRATYQFQPHDPLNPPKEDEDLYTRFSRYKPDPHNPLTFVFERDEEHTDSFELTRSVIEMPNAPKQPWIRPRKDIPKGIVKMHRIYSTILENERRVWVYTPPDFEEYSADEVGLLLLFDGVSYTNLVPTPIILDNLLYEEMLPPMIIVIPDSLGTEVRIRELIYHSPFNEFLVNELLPWIHKNYKVSSNPRKTVVGGASAGGLAAAFAAIEQSEIFGNVLSQSGAFSFGYPGEEGYEWLTKQIELRERLPIRFYLDAGSLEVRSLRPLGDAPNLVKSTHNLRDVLQRKGYEVKYNEFSGGHDYVSWRGTFPEGLQWLLQNK